MNAKPPNYLASSQGLTLSEVVLTLGLVGASMITILGMMTTGMTMHQRSEDRTVAQFIAERIFSDLQLPTEGVKPGFTTGRFLGEFQSSSDSNIDVYGSVLDYRKDQIPESSENAPPCWLFGKSIQNIPHSSSTASFLNNSKSIYENGAREDNLYEAHYLAGVWVSGKFLFGARDDVESGSSSVRVEAKEQDGSAQRLVIVSIEIPASAPKEARRKYRFERVLKLGN